jgi:hypothetical protein
MNRCLLQCESERETMLYRLASAYFYAQVFAVRKNSVHRGTGDEHFNTVG